MFFSRRAPRQIPGVLPSMEDEIEDSAIAKAHEIIQKTHREMASKYRAIANRKRKNQTVDENSLVWVRSETMVPNTSRKLNPKWCGPYRVTKVYRDGAKYELCNLFTQHIIERAAEKVKPFVGQEQWLIEMEEMQEIPPDVVDDWVLETRGARNVVPPSRLIEEI